MSVVIHPYFHRESFTFSYVVVDEQSKECAIIDPCYDFDLASGKICTDFTQSMVDFIRQNDLLCRWILETHAHADHLSSAQWIKHSIGGLHCIGSGITQVQLFFKSKFDFSDEFSVEGKQFDRLLGENDALELGRSQIRVVSTPGHTSDSISYWIEDNLFVGDTIFSPALGTARCDFPGGDAGVLFDSIQKFYQLPDATRIYLCHDYPIENQSPINCVSVGEQKRNNIHIQAKTSREEYISRRSLRDAGLAVPKLLFPAIQVNINAGIVPRDSGGKPKLLIPIQLPEFN